MFIEVHVEIPVNLSKKQRELLKEFDEETDQKKHSPHSSGFFDKVKEFWEDLTDK
jgi:molecular chaperone DnaJ